MLGDVVPTAVGIAGGSIGGGILIWAFRAWLQIDKTRQGQTTDTRDQLDKSHDREEELQVQIGNLQKSIGGLHDEINTIKRAASVADAHAEGLRVELEWRERQVTRLEAELKTLTTEKAVLERELAECRGGG